MGDPDFYLASSEGYGLEEPRSAYKVKSLKGPKRDDFYLIRIEPPLIGQQFGLGGKDIREVIIVPRHEGFCLHDIREYPVAVYVLRPMEADIGWKDEIAEDDFNLIGWAEIYRTEEDARSLQSG